MKVNLDLTATAAENLISDELHNNVGAAAFNLDHDFFYGDTELEIWTGAGKTGTQLIENTDYTLAGVDSNLTARAGRNVYTTVTIDNVTYQTGNLYFTYQATADYVDALDRYRVVRKYFGTGTGEDILLESDVDNASGTGGDITIQTSSTLGTAGEVHLKADGKDLIQLHPSGAVYINAIGGIIDLGTISADAVQIYSSGGLVDIHSNKDHASQNAIKIQGNNGGIIEISTVAGTTNPNPDIKLNTVGGIDVDSVLGVHIKDLYAGTGTGNGITLLADNNNASGTGGNLTLQTTATSGTPGDIIIGSAAALTFDDQYTTAAIPFSETGETGLDTTATSIVGAINELVGGTGNSLDDAYNLGSAITVDTTDVDWVLSASRDFRIYDATDANKFVVTNGTAIDSIKIDTSGGLDIDVETRVDITQDITSGSGHAGINLTTDNHWALATAQDINLLAKESAGGAGGSIRLTTQGTISGNILLDSGGYIYVDADEDSRFQVTSSNLDLKTVTSGNVTIDSAAAISLKTAATTRVTINAVGDTVFYGTASTTGALPVITLDQADTDEPFLKVIGDAALADLTRNIVDTGDVTTPTIVGYIKIEILDDGNQVTDGDYFIPFYSLA